MPVEIRVPEFGESVVEATVGRWMKREGEPVAAGEPVVELETEKVNAEVSADRAGVLEKIVEPEGATVHPGDVLGLIAEGARATAAPPGPAPAAAAPPAPAPERPPGPAGAAPAAPAEAEWKPTSPGARELAARLGVDLSRVAGTGRGGRITYEDVARYAERASEAAEAERRQPTPAAAAPPAPTVERPGPAAPPTEGAAPGARREERVRLSRRRLTIARRLMEAQQTTASLTTFNEVDVSAVQEVRRRRGEAFRERHGVKLGLMSFFTKAVVAALKSFPQMNSELDGDELVLKRYYDIGIAVSTKSGLVVPVLRDADRLSFGEIERAIDDLATRARENQLTLGELVGGTFTITNGGVFGSLLSTPILNAPQVGILGMHKIQERPVAIGGQVVIRPMMYLALTYDHRVVDGREAVQFLVRVKELIEDPEELLLGG